MKRFFFSFLLCIGLSATLHAVTPDEQLADPVLEARARVISQELRCVVCQNQSIDDSDAQLAKDLRLLVRERLVAGDSDQQVINFITARYGEFVLLKPRFAPHTLALWIAPFAFLLFGAWIAIVVVRNRQAEGAPEAGLSSDEEAKLAAILKKQEEGKNVEQTPTDHLSRSPRG